MDYETIAAAILVAVLVFFSIDFHKYYTTEFQEAARNPMLRFLAGLLIVWIASINPILAAIALTIVFFWIADVHLLSSISYPRCVRLAVQCEDLRA